MQPNEGLEADQFELTTQLLNDAGYNQYELSNYARPQREAQHNEAYWQGRDYLGLGPSAFSTVGSRRWRNIRETGIYSQSTLCGKTAVDFEESISDELRSRERAAFGMRTLHGLHSSEVTFWDKELGVLQVQGLVDKKNDRWTLTAKGRLLADSVSEIFV